MVPEKPNEQLMSISIFVCLFSKRKETSLIPENRTERRVSGKQKATQDMLAQSGVAFFVMQ